MKLGKTTFLAAAFFSAVLAARGEMLDAIQAIVGDSVITLQQVRRATLPDEEAIYQKSTLESENATRTKIVALRQDALNSLVNRQVVLQEFKRLEKDKGVKIPDSYVDQSVQETIRKSYSGDRVRFDKDLEAEGITREQFRQQQRDRIIYDTMQQQFVPDPIISPLKVETYYRQHQDQFTVQARIKYRWIGMDKSADDTNDVSRKRMEEILSRIKDGADFADLAQTYAELLHHSNLQPHDDEWLEISKLNDAFQNEVAKLKAGQCTGVIEAPQGFFVLRVDELDPAHVAPLNDVRVEIGRALLAQERNRRYEVWIKRLKSKTLVTEF